MFSYIVGSIIFLILIYLIVQGIRCNFAVQKSKERLKSMEAETANLSYGDMKYIDKGQGEVILSAHGLFGGYDQAYDICKDFNYSGRIIAPSRFGYLGSDTLGKGKPKGQAAAYIELLDKLGIEKVYIFGVSAGGTIAIRFALDYPERTKGLILYSSAPPLIEKTEKYSKYAGPPKFLTNNYGMFLISPFFELSMSMESSTINSMLPINERRKGIELDATINNPDMARNFDDYKIGNLKVPSIIFHAKDDKMVKYKDMEKVINRFPNCTFVSFETGGHMIKGHIEKIGNSIENFIENSK